MPVARKDAVRNRERLLTAAAVLVARHGTEIDVREIARHAGVGMGTLYRHFPTKQTLLDATLGHALDDWVDSARAARTGEPWPDLCRFVADALERHACDRGLNRCYDEPFDCLGQREHRARELIAEFVEPAKANGSMRPDATVEDVRMLLTAFGWLASRSPDGWQRTLRFTLDGLRAPGRETASSPPDGEPLQYRLDRRG